MTCRRRRAHRRALWVIGVTLVGCGSHAGRPATEDSATTAAVAAVAPAALDACDTLAALLTRLPGLRLERLAAAALDASWRGAGARPSCRLRAGGHFVGEYSSVDTLVAWLQRGGWDERTVFSADGPDGTHRGLHRAGVTCILEGRWDGGDDADDTYVPSDTLEIVGACAAAAATDTTPRD